MGPQPNNKNFFGIAVSQPGIDVNTASLSQMLYTNNYTTTTWRDSNGKVQLQEGLIGTNQYGLSAGGGSVVLDASGLSAGGGSVVLDASGLSLNPTNSTNSIQLNSIQFSVYQNGIEQIRIGLLPDGTYGMVITKPGISVDGAYS